MIPGGSTAVAIEIGPVVPFIIIKDRWKFNSTVSAGRSISILRGRYYRSASSLLSPDMFMNHRSASGVNASRDTRITLFYRKVF